MEFGSSKTRKDPPVALVEHAKTFVEMDDAKRWCAWPSDVRAQRLHKVVRKTARVRRLGGSLSFFNLRRFEAIPCRTQRRKGMERRGCSAVTDTH
jgi:hypothetical protein